MENATPITAEMLAGFEKNYQSRKDLQTLSVVMSNTSLHDAAYNAIAAQRLRMDFSIEVPTTGVTNQKQSGRCWMFSSLNMLRERVIQKYELRDFQFSLAYMAFFDKLEKANNFLEGALHYSADPVNSRENESLFGGPIPDGGQWDMLVGLVEKYGLVPNWVMPETAYSEGTKDGNYILAQKLAQDGLELREIKNAGGDPSLRRTEMLAEIYNALCILYGQPPKKFTFEFTDRSGTYHNKGSMSPMQFYRECCNGNLTDYAGIISSPLHEYGRTYCQPFMGSRVDYDVLWLNVPIEDMEALAIEQLKSGESVMFSCDSGAFGERSKGYWDPDSFAYGEVLGGMELGMSKRERLLTKQSTMSHCMLLCGVNLDENGKPDRWKIENSWGEANGQKGYYVCSEKYFREYAMQITVHRSFLNLEQRKQFMQKPIPMNLWDPLA